MCKQFRNDIIPPRITDMIERYVEYGISGGGCLTAILSNDLRGAFARADAEVVERMVDIVEYLYNEVLGACWGSPERVKQWMARGGRKGGQRGEEDDNRRCEMEKIYIFHSDPGHGWLAVKKAELNALGIADKISCYSYVKGDTVYLEEDCDATLFFKAKKDRGEKVEYRENITDYRSPIRSYDRYKVNERQ